MADKQRRSAELVELKGRRSSPLIFPSTILPEPEKALRLGATASFTVPFPSF